MMDQQRKEETLARIEALFVRYGAQPMTGERSPALSGERSVSVRDGIFYRAGTAEFDGQLFFLLSSVEREKFAEFGLLEDIDALPCDAGPEELDLAVRRAFGLAAYPEDYMRP